MEQSNVLAVQKRRVLAVCVAALVLFVSEAWQYFSWRYLGK